MLKEETIAMHYTQHQPVVMRRWCRYWSTGEVDVNAQRGEYGNALYAASAEGHGKVVQILVEAGADVNARGGEYGMHCTQHYFVVRRKVMQILRPLANRYRHVQKLCGEP
jgi:hypothetical protein